MCPNCKKKSYCGCNSCKSRKGMFRLRTKKMNGDLTKCPYCKMVFNTYEWEEFNLSLTLK